MAASRFHSAFAVVLFATLSISALLSMDIISLMRLHPSPSSTGKIEWEGGSVPILRRFHFLPFLDEVIRDVTVGFAPSTFTGYDDVSWWQMIGFLNDAGLMHFIWLLESSRPGAKGTAIYFPAVLQTVAQLVGGGVIYPVYYCMHIFHGRRASSGGPRAGLIDLSDGFIYVPLLLLFHTIPVMGMYLAPSMQDRHWWTWMWQLYPVRVTIGYYLVQSVSRMLRWPKERVGFNLNYQTTLRLLMAPLIAVSAAVWIYVVLSTPYSLYTVFWPAQTKASLEGTFVGLMSRLLQFDQWFAMTSSFAWLWVLMADMTDVQRQPGIRTVFFLANLGLLPVIGPGATFAVMWLVREKYLVGTDNEAKGLKST